MPYREQYRIGRRVPLVDIILAGTVAVGAGLFVEYVFPKASVSQAAISAPVAQYSPTPGKAYAPRGN